MAIANNNEEKPLIIYTFKELCNGEQWLAAQHSNSIRSLKACSLSCHCMCNYIQINAHTSNTLISSLQYDCC